MLILTRRIGETVMIGDNVTLTVLLVRGNQVRLGINAPKEVAVHRKEIYERIQSGEPQGPAQGNRLQNADKQAKQGNSNGHSSNKNNDDYEVRDLGQDIHIEQDAKTNGTVVSSDRVKDIKVSGVGDAGDKVNGDLANDDTAIVDTTINQTKDMNDDVNNADSMSDEDPNDNIGNRIDSSPRHKPQHKPRRYSGGGRSSPRQRSYQPNKNRANNPWA